MIFLKEQSFLLQTNITILIILSIISCSYSQISSIIPLYKIIAAEDINKIKTNQKYGYLYNTKGIGIIFNSNYNISIIPKQLFYNIYRYYHDVYFYPDKIENIVGGYEQYILFETIKPHETIHFILKDYGIIIPLKDLFFTKEDDEDLIYYFRFLTKEDQENIIIGKDLINLMDVTFENNNIIINNKDYISKIVDENK